MFCINIYFFPDELNKSKEENIKDIYKELQVISDKLKVILGYQNPNSCN